MGKQSGENRLLSTSCVGHFFIRSKGRDLSLKAASGPVEAQRSVRADSEMRVIWVKQSVCSSMASLLENLGSYNLP